MKKLSEIVKQYKSFYAARMALGVSDGSLKNLLKNDAIIINNEPYTKSKVKLNLKEQGK